MSSPPDIVSKGIMLFVRSDIVAMISQWTAWTVLMTDRKYSLVSTDVLIRVWRSKVKVTAGRGGIHVDAGASKSML